METIQGNGYCPRPIKRDPSPWNVYVVLPSQGKGHAMGSRARF